MRGIRSTIRSNLIIINTFLPDLPPIRLVGIGTDRSTSSLTIKHSSPTLTALSHRRRSQTRPGSRLFDCTFASSACGSGRAHHPLRPCAMPPSQALDPNTRPGLPQVVAVSVTASGALADTRASRAAPRQSPPQQADPSAPPPAAADASDCCCLPCGGAPTVQREVRHAPRRTLDRLRARAGGGNPTRKVES